MKKILALLLCAGMLTAAGTTALAAETNTGGNSSADVSGTYRNGGEAPVTVSADITWDEMKFTYTEGGKYWNPVTHKVEQAEGKWSDDRKSITVTNHSNTEIKASFSFAGSGTVTGEFDREVINLATAKGTAYDEAPADTVSFGIIDGTLAASGTLGTITVTVATDSVNSIEELIAAIRKGGEFKLGKDLTLTEGLTAYGGMDFDMNGKTISGETSVPLFSFSAVAVVRNGTFHKSGSSGDAITATGSCALTMENCTIISDESSALYIGNRAAVSLEDCTVGSGSSFSAIKVDSGSTLFFSGKTTLNGDLEIAEGGKVICYEGEYNFDPTAYVNSSYDKVTESGGIWTVTSK